MMSNLSGVVYFETALRRRRQRKFRPTDNKLANGSPLASSSSLPLLPLLLLSIQYAEMYAADVKGPSRGQSVSRAAGRPAGAPVAMALALG